MYEDEQPTVEGIFRDTYQSVRPLTIIWREKIITITEIGYVQKLQEGKVVRHVFSCTDGVNFYELIFHDKHLAILEKHLVGTNQGVNDETDSVAHAERVHVYG